MTDKKYKFETNIYAGKQIKFFDFKEIWRFRELIFQWIKRDWISGYKQTILGPIWPILQPFAATIVYTFVFGNIAKLSPEGVPVFLFFMSGQIFWNFFSSSFSFVSTIYLANSYIMGKVYFHRAILPIYALLERLIPFGIQFLIFILLYVLTLGSNISAYLQPTVLLLPLIVLQLMVLALGLGLIFATLTRKYRDLMMIQSYLLSAWMYFCPLVYDIKLVPQEYYNIYLLNPITPIVMLIRNAFFNGPLPPLAFYLISVAVTLLVLIIGVNVFKKVEANILDTM